MGVIGWERVMDLKEWFSKYREQLLYLFFGVLTTVLNIATYAALHVALGVHSDIANAAAWLAAVSVAYVTNRIWVFRSRTRGAALLRELGAFMAGRVLTGVMDEGIMHVATQIVGPRLIPAAWRSLWDMGVKFASNVLVVILNYVFSKRIIFKRGGKERQKA